MYDLCELTKNGLIHLSEAEEEAVFNRMSVDRDYHYLSFNLDIGFNWAGTYALKCNPSFREDEKNAVIKELIAKREVRSLRDYHINMTIYPITKNEDSEDEIDLENIDKHFDDILKLNDNVYKTKYLIVDCDSGYVHFDQEPVLRKLRELLEKSKILKKIYIFPMK